MAGVKGKSGRKSRYQHIQDGNLLEICTNWLVTNFHTFTDDIIKVAMEIAKKGIVQRVDANVNHSAKTILDSVQDASTNRIAGHV